VVFGKDFEGALLVGALGSSLFLKMIESLLGGGKIFMALFMQL
jgi:hypothetical protein